MRLRLSIKFLILVSLMVLFIPVTSDIKLKKKVVDIIKQNKINSIYSGYIYIPKFKYKNLIKKGSDTINNNLVELVDFSDELEGNKIILAGHNNRQVFNKIYYLDIGDEIYISDFKSDYRYVVSGNKYIDVDDFSEFNNDLTLITCTNNNQERFIVKAKRE